MLLGHTGMNWALKYLPAYVVNLTVLGEPVGATLLGALIPAIAQVPLVDDADWRSGRARRRCRRRSRDKIERVS